MDFNFKRGIYFINAVLSLLGTIVNYYVGDIHLSFICLAIYSIWAVAYIQS